MAFAGSIAPCRKTTTYGKHSRRLNPNLSSATEVEFAQDLGVNIVDPKDTTRHWQDGRHASSNLLHGRSESEVGAENSPFQRFSSTSKPNDQLRSSFGRIDFTEDEFLYDGREDRIELARKRRKVMPNRVVAEKKSPVYDDDSLQRHIAAEARKHEDQVLHLPSNSNTSAAECSKPRRGGVTIRAGLRGSKESMSESPRATPSRNDSTLDRERTGNDVKTAVRTKGRLVARAQSKGLAGAKITPYRVQKTNRDLAETTARSTTPEMVSDEQDPQASTKNTRSLNTSRYSVYQPTTPPRLTMATREATTPRQRELWRRLLVDNTQTKTPSSLDLPGLILNESKIEGSHGHANSRKVSRGARQSATLKARPGKIIDNLHLSDLDQDHLYERFDETRGTSSSENRSEYIHSDVSAVDIAVTVQKSPGADGPDIVSQSQNRPSNPSPAHSSLHGGGYKVTYAHQRSYLTDDDLKGAAMIGLPVPPEPNNRGGYGRRGMPDGVPRLQSRQSLDAEIGELVDSQGVHLRSIHELREAGGNVRLVSELEAILDDIGDHQPGSTSIRHTRLIDLVTKLEEPANCRLFVDQGLESRLMAEVALCNEVITNGLLVAALLQLMTYSSSSLLLTQVGDIRVIEFLIDLLGSDQDILAYARLRGSNVSKATLADLGNLCSALCKSTAWRAGKPSVLSCHVLSLQCLEYLVRQSREAGSLSEVLSAHAIRRVVGTSVPPFPTLPPQDGEISIVCLELAISILESCTISNAAECHASLWAGETLERVVQLLPLLILWKGEQCGTSRTLTLRLYLNVTNNSPGLCKDFSTPEVISVMFGIVSSHFEQLADTTLQVDKALLLDDLILSLGSLINLADLSQRARELMMDLRQGSQSYLDILLQLFINKSRKAAEVRILSATRHLLALIGLGFLLGRDQLQCCFGVGLSTTRLAVP